MCVDVTEMFRDPSLWRVLNDEYFPQLINNTPNFKIWFPEVSSGEELYSTAIVLKKLNLLNNVQFIVSSISEKNLENVKTGIFDPKRSKPTMQTISVFMPSRNYRIILHTKTIKLIGILL